jgi:hypothetical protein
MAELMAVRADRMTLVRGILDGLEEASWHALARVPRRPAVPSRHGRSATV